jgi:predicted PurR-regulated permease PerM
MREKLPDQGVVATILTLCLGAGIVVPGMWVADTLIDAAITGVSAILPTTASQFERQYPQLREALEKIESALQISTSLGELLQTLSQQTRHLITISAWGAVSLLLTLFTFFYMIRDGERFLNRLEEFLPLSRDERNLLYGRISDTIHATLFGSVAVSAVQGLLGALLFWWLALPGAALWGLLMGLLALVPYLGAFVVWIPLAALFFIQGQWHNAILITAWGMIVIGLSDNLLYPILVGKRLRYHSLLVFFFLVGGVWCFGAAGIIIGPVVLAIVDTAIDIWKGSSYTVL